MKCGDSPRESPRPVPRLSGAEIEVIQRAAKHQRKIGFLAGERAIQRSYDVNLV